MPRLRTSPNIDRIWHGALFAAAMPAMPFRSERASRLTISLHSRQPDQSACRVICWLARLMGNPSRVVTRRSHASESPLKEFLIEDCQLCDTFHEVPLDIRKVHRQT